MNIVVFGGTGLIGQAFCRHAMINNHYPIVVSRRPQKHTIPYKLISFSDIVQPDVQRLFSNKYAVVNLMGASIANKRWTKERKEYLHRSRIDILSRIELFLQQAPQEPQVFIQASAIGYYGKSAEDNLTEMSNQGDGFLADLAAKWEERFNQLSLEETRPIIIRTGVVLSKLGGMLPRVMLPFKYGLGGHIGSGKQHLSWIHIEDHVRAILFLIENVYTRGVFNLTAPKPVSMKTFAKALGKAMHKPSFVPVPAWVLKLMYGQMAQETMLQGAKVLPEKLINHEFEFVFDDIDLALKNIFRG